MNVQRICEVSGCGSTFRVHRVDNDTRLMCNRHYLRFRKYGATELECETIDSIPGEIWKDVEGYGGAYKVSNYGRVMSVGAKQPKRILKPGGTRYSNVSLTLGKITRTHTVHRLVMEAFRPNDTPGLVINHKDFNRRNNKLDNLEWCTQKDNAIHAYRGGRFPIRRHCITCNCEKFGIIKQSSN